MDMAEATEPKEAEEKMPLSVMESKDSPSKDDEDEDWEPIFVEVRTPPSLNE